MPQPKKGARLGSGPKHQKLMMANLAVSLFDHESITTTVAKAKMLRPYAEKLITKAKSGTVHDRRKVLSHIEDREIVHKLFADIAPRFSDRNGGYTRILKLGPRNGDNAPMALIELVEGGETDPRRGDRRNDPDRAAASAVPAVARRPKRPRTSSRPTRCPRRSSTMPRLRPKRTSPTPTSSSDESSEDADGRGYR